MSQTMRFTFILAFQVMLLSGLSAHQGYYTVTFPNDTTIYGCGAAAPVVQPVISKYGPCNFNVGVSYQDEVFFLNGNSGCYKIARRWRLIWWCDYDPNAMQPTVVPNPANSDQGPTVDATALNHGFLEYTQYIKVLDGQDPVIANCPGTQDLCDLTDNDAQLWNAPFWVDIPTGKHDLCELPVDLFLNAFDSCSGADLKARYLLYLDLDNNGTMETLVSSANPPQAGTILFDNTTGSGKVRAFDFRNVLSTQKYRFAVETSVDPASGLFFAALRWNTEQQPGTYVLPQLPAGKHKIKWIIEDGCGNESVCEYAFSIKDCKAPTVVCINGLSVNIMPTGMVMLQDTDFVQYFYDNCTPDNLIQFGIRKAGTGTGFPVNAHTVTFDCTELGKQEVEVWAIDADGNADFCQTYVDVQNNNGVCGPSSKFAGQVNTPSNKPLSGVPVYLYQSGQMVAAAQSDSVGVFAFDAQASGCDYVLAPAFDAPAKTGVNTLDVLLTALHAANLMPLGTPLAMLAADADGNGQIDHADLLPMVQVLLGGADAFPGQNSWQFIPTSTVFADPSNPFSQAVDQQLVLCLMPDASPNPQFTAVKTGDVNHTASAGVKNDADDRAPSVYFTVKQGRFSAGQTVRVPVMSPDLDGLAGFQLALQFDPAVLSLQNVEPVLVPGEWTVVDPLAGSVRASWHSLDAFIGVAGKDAKSELFILTFTALKEGVLSNHLRLDATSLSSETYNKSLSVSVAGLRFERPVSPRREAFTLVQVQPNPATDRVVVSCFQAEAGDVQFRWVDAQGSVQGTENLFLPQGEQQVALDVPVLQPGLMYLHAQSGYGNGVLKVVVE